MSTSRRITKASPVGVSPSMQTRSFSKEKSPEKKLKNISTSKRQTPQAKSSPAAGNLEHLNQLIVI